MYEVPAEIIPHQLCNGERGSHPSILEGFFLCITLTELFQRNYLSDSLQ